MALSHPWAVLLHSWVIGPTYCILWSTHQTPVPRNFLTIFCRNLSCLYTDILPFQQTPAWLKVPMSTMACNYRVSWICPKKTSSTSPLVQVVCSRCLVLCLVLVCALIHNLLTDLSPVPKQSFDQLLELVICQSTSLPSWPGLSKGPTFFCCSIQAMWAIPSHPK